MELWEQGYASWLFQTPNDSNDLSIGMRPRVGQLEANPSRNFLDEVVQEDEMNRFAVWHLMIRRLEILFWYAHAIVIKFSSNGGKTVKHDSSISHSHSKAMESVASVVQNNMGCHRRAASCSERKCDAELNHPHFDSDPNLPLSREKYLSLSQQPVPLQWSCRGTRSLSHYVIRYNFNGSVYYAFTWPLCRTHIQVPFTMPSPDSLDELISKHCSES